jgi:hypothetical protein
MIRVLGHSKVSWNWIRTGIWEKILFLEYDVELYVICILIVYNFEILFNNPGLMDWPCKGHFIFTTYKEIINDYENKK